MAQQISQTLHDRQPEAKTAAAFARGIVELMVFLEDRLKLLSGMPMPVSQTSMLSTPARRRQPSSTLPCLVYFSAFDEQVADHLLQQARIAVDRQAARRRRANAMPLRLRVIGELVPQPVKQIVDGKSTISARTVPASI